MRYIVAFTVVVWWCGRLEQKGSICPEAGVLPLVQISLRMLISEVCLC